MVHRDVDLGVANRIDLGGKLYKRLSEFGVGRVGHPQGGADIGGAKGDDVDARYGSDLGDLVQATFVFSHDDQKNLFIGGLHVFQPRDGSVTGGPSAASPAAFSLRGIPDCLDSSLCSLNSGDVGYLNSLGSHVQQPQDGLGVVVGHADHRCDVTQVGDTNHLAHGLHVKDGVFHIDERAVEPGFSNYLNDCRVGESYVAHQGQTALAHHFFNPVLFHDLLRV